MTGVAGNPLIFHPAISSTADNLTHCSKFFVPILKCLTVSLSKVAHINRHV